MPKNRILFANENYDIKKIEEDIEARIPILLHTAYFDDMVIMPKCRCSVSLAGLDIPPFLRAESTSGYIALIRKCYKSKKLKRGCIVRIIEYITNEKEEDEAEEEIVIVKVEGLKRFISYENAKVDGYEYELIKPDFQQFENDNTSSPIPINFDTLDPIFIQFFMQFIGMQELETKLEFSTISLDKFLNSLIMIMPISDVERLYLSEIPSLGKRQDALSLILNCNFSGLTNGYEYH